MPSFNGNWIVVIRQKWQLFSFKQFLAGAGLLLLLKYLVELYYYSRPDNSIITVFFVQFAAGFAANLYSRRSGRMTVIAGALLFPGAIPLLSSPGAVFPAGLFAGAAAGIIIREAVIRFFTEESALADPFGRWVKKNFAALGQQSIKNHALAGLFVFFVAIILERIVIYFNAPFIKGFGLSEYMYMPGISSRQALGMSLDIAAGLLFPVFYFILETRMSSAANPPWREWYHGLVAGFIINAVVRVIQSLDSGFMSSGYGPGNLWVMAVIGSLFLRDLYHAAWSRMFRSVLSVSILAILYYIGRQAEPFYLLIVLLSLLFLLLEVVWNSFVPLWKKSAGVAGALIVISAVFYLLNAYGRTYLPDIAARAADSFSGESIRDVVRANMTVLDKLKGKMIFGAGTGTLPLEPGLYGIRQKIILPSIILHNTGIAGFVSMLMWVFFTIYRKQTVFPLFLLGIISFSGYNGPENLFLILLLLLIYPDKKNTARLYGFFNAFIAGFSVLFLIHSLYDVNLEARGPAFRKKVTGKYQLSADEKIYHPAGFYYYRFTGKTAWKTGGRIIRPGVFLENSSSKDFVMQKWSVLNAEMDVIASKTVKILKNRTSPEVMGLPPESYYFMIEELDRNGNVRKFSAESYGIAVSRFGGINEIY